MVLFTGSVYKARCSVSGEKDRGSEGLNGKGFEAHSIQTTHLDLSNLPALATVCLDMYVFIWSCLLFNSILWLLYSVLLLGQVLFFFIFHDLLAPSVSHVVALLKG